MDIDILGAGVGGVTTGLALAPLGYNVSLYERTPGPAHIGAGIVLWPNASFVLHELGVLPALAALAGRPEKMRRLSAQGEDLGYLDITELDRRMGFPSHSILRRDLQTVLLRALQRHGVTVHYQHLVSSIESDGDGRARVNFQNGLQRKPDMVIGADGRMHSIARQFVHGDNRPVYQGFVNWIGVCESRKPLVDDLAVCDFWGTGERFGVVPITRNKVYWAGGMAQPLPEQAATGPYREELLSLFGRWADPVARIIEHTPSDAINRIFVHDHEPINLWHRENVLLLGDAAHAPLPTSGQGACQAMEDAWHLARCLQDPPADLAAVFQDYTESRRQKTAAITHAARSLAASLFNRDAEFCRQRNLRSRSTDYRAAVEGMARGWAQGLPIGPAA